MGTQDLEIVVVVFQSTPPHGRRLITVNLVFTVLSFNPRLHTGGDKAPACTCSSFICFNPRLHTGGDQRYQTSRELFGLFQSTPPHGRRLAKYGTWYGRKLAFQSTPPHGRRPLGPDAQGYQSRFQSTPPHGRRPEAAEPPRPERKVSIHASTREATGAGQSHHASLQSVSIHASTREATI